MEGKGDQGTATTFEGYEGDGYVGWHLPKGVNEVELREVIRRIYDDRLTEEMLAPKFRFELLRLLLPSCPEKALASAKRNYSSYKNTNIIHHLLRVVPQLFIASIHYCDYGRCGPTTNLDEPVARCKRHLYDTRLERILFSHLGDRDMLHTQIDDLQAGKGYILESEHIREIKELEERHKQELEDETYKVAKKKEMEKVELEQQVGSLKHQIRMLLWQMKCSGMKLPQLSTELIANLGDSKSECSSCEKGEVERGSDTKGKGD